jgi:hypothetical protein
MREIRPSGSEGGARSVPCPYPYRHITGTASVLKAGIWSAFNISISQRVV